MPGREAGRAEADSSLVALRSGAEAVRAGSLSTAIASLRPVFEASPGRMEESVGSVAYWLGEAYRRSGEAEEAVRVWRIGTSRMLEASGRLDYRLLDAFIRRVSTMKGVAGKPLAARAYANMLVRFDERRPGPTGRSIVQRHLKEAVVVAPDSVRRAIGGSLDPETWAIRVDPTPQAGAHLMAWWRSQDPLPATRQNERLLEHLRRTAQARTQYAHEGRLDHRGIVFIRLGEPDRDVSVGMEDNDRTSSIAEDIRRNEFWTYHHVDRRARFLFVEREPNRYTIGSVADLFPPDLKTGTVGFSGQAQIQGLQYLYLLEEVLRELGTYHEAYVSFASDVFDRAAWARDNAQFGIGEDPVEGSVGGYLQTMEGQLRALAQKSERERQEHVPRSYTNVLRNVPSLPVAARMTRFRTPDGKTQVQIDWSVRTADLTSGSATGRSPERFALAATAVRRAADFRRAETQQQDFFIAPSQSPGAILTPRQFRFTVPDSVVHTTVQWNLYGLSKTEAGSPRIGSTRSQHTETWTGIRPLSGGPDDLAMSDIRLLVLPDDRSGRTSILERAIPYPFQQARASRPLVLTFEVYNLEQGTNERTRYTVSYETRRQVETRRFLGLFGSDEEETTAATSTYRGRNTRTQESILLDTEGLGQDPPKPVTITVRVTDEISGEEVERDVTIDLASTGTD